MITNEIERNYMIIVEADNILGGFTDIFDLICMHILASTDTG